jgi:hypothetical protein
MTCLYYRWSITFKQAVTIDHPLISCQTAVPQQCVTPTSTCLNFFKYYRLPKFPPSPRLLKWQNVAKCWLMQVTKGLGSASGHPIQFFHCRDKRPSSGEWLTAVSASLKKYDTSMTAVRLHHSDVWNVVEVTLPFECCIFETERMETWGNSLRFWNRKCIKWVKKLFCQEICYFLGRKFSCAGM